MYMKNTREIAEEYRLSHWAGIMRERAGSGLSIKAYCEREGMPPNRYFYWQRKLREAAVNELSSPEASALPAPVGWTQVEETKPPKAEGSEVVVEIGSSRIVLRACLKSIENEPDEGQNNELHKVMGVSFRCVLQYSIFSMQYPLVILS